MGFVGVMSGLRKSESSDNFTSNPIVTKSGDFGGSCLGYRCSYDWVMIALDLLVETVGSKILSTAFHKAILSKLQ